MRARDDSAAGREERAAVLKERIYLTFASLAVVLALAGHGEPTAKEALATLGITLAGTVLAVFTADVVSHVVVHESLPTTDELRHIVGTLVGALGGVALPFVFLGLAAIGAWEPARALHASAVALIVALVVIGWLAVRRARIAWWQRLLVLGAEAVLGLAVIGLQSLAHA
ncbi:hypothetical protein [Agrococcus sp. SGAir0287]|uniref:hypothetical protein n=1 Tax=Agrococcus sp. SGAir0287 TaxID=2070347 RepID=UPI0010CCD90E|nr:hypothetical protein [Agrococcus sp. SGAir0287]QCR19431.1 hypothetical protein C1N71_08305 [Agrococcus sp. SGAir0287]